MDTNTQSTVLRKRVAKQNEDAVIAENALEMEKLVSIVRLVTIVLFAAALILSRGIFGVRGVRDVPRALAALLYMIFALGTFFALRREKPDFRKATKAEFLMSVVDFAFVTFSGLRTWEAEHIVSAAQGATMMCLLICFSLGRVNVLHVAFSWALALGSFFTLAWRTDGVDPRGLLLVTGLFTALAVMVGMMQRRVRAMFIKLRKRDNLTRFLPPQVVEEVMSRGDSALAPVQREVTVLFSDIRDFTTFSETLPPGAVLAFLDEYLGHMSHLVKEHDGIVNKFLGDGMLAFWGVPHRNAKHAELAVKAALDMRKVVEELNQVRINNGAKPFRIGIGIHTGQVAAGMLGGADQHEYTVIGDAVNVASRVEGLTKQLGVDVLVSESTWRLLDGRFSGHRHAEQYVKGRQEAVVVYSLGERLPKVDAA